MNKKYAIFDMDGTLVDSMAYWRNLGREYLRGKGVNENLDEIMERIRPMTMTESAQLFLEEFSLEGTAQSVADEMNAIMDRHYQDDIPLKEGVKEYLTKLHHRGVRMCVASATAESLKSACLERLGVAEYFEFLLSCETIGAGKSQPDVYFESAKRLGALPSEIAVYEDAAYAVKTAKHAGFYTIAIYDDSTKHKWERLKEMADEHITNWRDVTK